MLLEDQVEANSEANAEFPTLLRAPGVCRCPLWSHWQQAWDCHALGSAYWFVLSVRAQSCEGLKQQFRVLGTSQNLPRINKLFLPSVAELSLVVTERGGDSLALCLVSIVMI